MREQPATMRSCEARQHVHSNINITLQERSGRGGRGKGSITPSACLAMLCPSFPGHSPVPIPTNQNHPQPLRPSSTKASLLMVKQLTLTEQLTRYKTLFCWEISACGFGVMHSLFYLHYQLQKLRFREVERMARCGGAETEIQAMLLQSPGFWPLCYTFLVAKLVASKFSLLPPPARYHLCF